MPEKIGKYHVIERIGRGGMGMIFKARDPILDRLVALKVISTDVDVTDELRTRFFREAQACAKLNHPNIVTVYDMGEDDGRLFIVMELLEGQELRRVITPGTPLTLEDKLSVMVQVCGGLHYAHQKGIVHRDIKPGNIFLLANGRVKILDFGIARMAANEGLTRTGLIMGTLRYISPEQVRGRVDHRSDMFSIGSVFYELLALRPPFTGDDPMHLLEQLRTEDPPLLTEIDPTIPSQLAVIVQRAMRKDPAERFHDLEEMRSELELVQGALLEERQRVLARVRRQRDRIGQIQAELTERVGASAEEAPIQAITERSGLVALQGTEREFAGRIEVMEAKLAQAVALGPAFQRARELVDAGRFGDAVAAFEAIVADMPDNRLASEALGRARADAEGHNQRQVAADALQKARAALSGRRYTLCLETLKQVSALPLPHDLTEAVRALRDAAEGGLAEQERLRRARQQADEACEQMAKERIAAQAEDAAQRARGLWSEAEAMSAQAQAGLGREAYVEAAEGFDKAAATYRRALDEARRVQADERQAAERAGEMATESQRRAQAAGAPQYARELWDTAEARCAEAQAAFAAKAWSRAGPAFTDASALYRRAEDATRPARERERRRAEAARERAIEGGRSAATVDAEHRAPSTWNEAVGKFSQGEAAWLRQNYGKATEAFAAALALYHQAQAQVRELTRRQREEAGRQHQEMAERRRGAMALEAVSHAASELGEAEASAAAGDEALAREAWEDAGGAFERAAGLYRRAEERSREALRARAAAEQAAEATGVARGTAAEAQAARYAPAPWREAESAEARAVAALSQQQFVTAQPLFAEAGRLYAEAARAAGLAEEAEARRLDTMVHDAKRFLEAGDVAASLKHVNEVLRLDPGHAAGEALRAQALEASKRESARQAEAAARREQGPVEAVEPARGLPTPISVRIDAPTAPPGLDEAPTLLIRSADIGEQSTMLAGREDETVLARVKVSGGVVDSPAVESPLVEAEGAKSAPVAVRESLAARARRMSHAWGFRVGAVAAGVAGLAVATMLVLPSRSPSPLDGQPAQGAREVARQATKEKVASEKAEAEQVALAKVGALRAEVEKAAADKSAAEKAKSVKATVEEAAAEKVAAEKAAAARAAADKAAAAKVVAMKAEAERAAADRSRAELALKARAAADKAAAEKAVSERTAADRAATERAVAAKAAADKAASEKAAADRAAADKAVAEKAAVEKAAADKAAAEKAATEKAAAERAAAEKMVAAKAAADKAAADKAAADKAAAERALAPKRDAERTRDRAVKAEAARFAKELFDTAQAKFAEADGLASRQNFAAAGQAYQDAAERYLEAALRAQFVHELRVQADSARTRMLNEKQRVSGKQDSPDFKAALADERQASTLYEQLAYREAAEKFRAAEMLFIRAATPAPSSPTGRRQPPPSF